ncbi:lipid-A-disaccharide synthase-related protein [Oscillatoria sp. CS-180]|nr:lipid-A-disaccharide synthase-related protein [Oscillatoria sp. CS-180]
MVSRLLCISNGHGEDAIAVRILTALRSHQPTLDIAALSLVGEGTAFQKHDIPLVAATKTLPSGGFIYMDSRQLARDVAGGLMQLTWTQLKSLKQWAKGDGAVLAVGDIVPAAFAWWSGLPYAIVGTAKSAYYLRNEQGRLADLPWYAGWANSIYLPWERWLMNRDRCRAVVVRDQLTQLELQQLGISPVLAANPMMDGLGATAQGAQLQPHIHHALTIVLLPGSRAPEAYANWQVILSAVESVLRQYAPRQVYCLGAIAPALDLVPFRQALEEAGWQAEGDHVRNHFTYQNGGLILTQMAYSDCLQVAQVAIAMAGTATEQFVGLGKPAFTLPGKGPQFTPTFAKLQTRLLGESVVLVETADQVGAAMESVLADVDRLNSIQHNGIRRLGEPGAAEAIAAFLAQHL